jgi:hypothetical protein
MRIIHLSDLHIRKDLIPDQLTIIEALFDDLMAVKKETPPDIIVFSGDLTFSAQKDQFELAEKHFLMPLMRALDLTPDKVVLIPGNHDVDISLIDEFQEEGLRSKLVKRDTVNRLLDDHNLIASTTSRLDPWRDFHAAFYQGNAPTRCGPLAYVHDFGCDGKSVAFASVASCWRATGAGDDADRGHLLIGERQLATVKDKTRDADLRLIGWHHPIDWLADFDMRDAQTILGNSFQMLFTGHVHVANPSAFFNTRGSLISSAAGALYQHRDYLNSYSIVDIDFEKQLVEVNLRTYFEERRAFAPGVNTVKDGRWRAPLTTLDDGSSAVVVSPSNRDVGAAAILSEIRERSVIAETIPTDAEITLEDLLVPPVLLKVPYEQYLAASAPGVDARPERADIEADLKDARVLLIVGEESSGLTSSLEWLVLKVSKFNPALTPVKISFAELPPGKKPVEKQLRRALALTGIQLPRDIDLPPLAVAIDDVRPATNRAYGRHAERMADHISEATTDVFVLGCRSPDEAEVLARLSAVGLDATVRYLGPFARRDLRTLAAKFSPKKADDIVRLVSTTIATENLPRTPFVMATLARIISTGERWATEGAETGVLDAYVGLLLGRGKEPEDLSTGLDYVEFEDILSCLAERLIQLRRFSLTRSETESFLLEYFGQVGWTAPVDSIIDTLIRRRILMERLGVVSFRQLAVLYLFAAKHFNVSDDFRKYISTDLLSHAPVVRHAAALKRTDIDLLRSVGELVEQFVLAEVSPDNASLFAQIADEKGWDDDASLKRLLKLSFDGEEDDQSPAKLDEMLDQLDDLMAAATLNREVEQEKLSPMGRFFITAELVSAVLRNSELVKSPELKRQVLVQSLVAWSAFAAFLAADEDFAATLERGARLLRDSGLARDGGEEEILAELRLRGPILFAALPMSRQLATERLSGLLNDLLADDAFCTDPGLMLMGALLASRIRSAGWSRHLETLLRRHGQLRVVHDMVRWLAMWEYFYGQSHHPDDRTLLERVLADYAVEDGSFSREQDRVIARDQAIQRLRAHRLVLNGRQAKDRQQGHPGIRQIPEA